MNCKSCGNIILAGWIYCPCCGVKADGFARVEDRFASLDARIDALKGRIAIMEQSTSDSLAQPSPYPPVPTMAGNGTSMPPGVNAVPVPDLGGQGEGATSKPPATPGEIEKRIRALEDCIGEIDKRLNGDCKDINTHRTRIEALESKLPIFRVWLTRHGNRMLDIKRDLAAHQQALVELARVQGLKEEFAAWEQASEEDARKFEEGMTGPAESFPDLAARLAKMGEVAMQTASAGVPVEPAAKGLKPRTTQFITCPSCGLKTEVQCGGYVKLTNIQCACCKTVFDWMSTEAEESEPAAYEERIKALGDWQAVYERNQVNMQADLAAHQKAITELARVMGKEDGQKFDEKLLDVPPDRQCVDCGAYILPSACDKLHRCHPCARKYLKAELARLQTASAGVPMELAFGNNTGDEVTSTGSPASESIGELYKREGCRYRISGTQCSLLGAESCRRVECPLPIDTEAKS